MTTKKVPTLEQVTGPNFEESMTRLEKIVEELESGKLPLEESLTRFEEGVKLSSQLHRTLEEAEKRIERLVENANGPGTVPDGALSEGPEKPEGELPF
jgi:exodeoxyribonuclease VII small subunit